MNDKQQAKAAEPTITPLTANEMYQWLHMNMHNGNLTGREIFLNLQGDPLHFRISLTDEPRTIRVMQP
jgi:hypothetical protein